MSPAERGLRVRLIQASRRMNASGINQGRSGNVSTRVDGGFLVTPTGVPYEALNVADLVFVRPNGETEGPRKPSSEWRLHRDIYEKRAEVGAVVHTHSPHATAIACLRRSIPAFHYEVAFAGGNDIRCADYATFGSQELSDHALRALEGRRACLLANHGVAALGSDLDDAFAMAEKVEALARLYGQALQAGEPVLLDEVEMSRVVEKFRTYGRE
jgi:L-fuculose-phosphate aldolase